MRLALLALVGLLGCTSATPNGGSSGQPAPSGPPAGPGPSGAGAASGGASSAPLGPAAATPEGSWSSPSCGARTYPRKLTLKAGGTFDALDLVSPCPPKVSCVWSGIVSRSGTWQLEGSRVLLTEQGAKAPPAGQPLPATLSWSAGALTELAGQASCAYERTASP